LTANVGNEVDKVEWSSSTLIRCGVSREIPFRTWMEDEKRKRLKLEQMEDSMGNGVNVMNGRIEAVLRRDNDVEKRQAIKKGSKQAASKQSE
jgi:hypothetical protein